MSPDAPNLTLGEYLRQERERRGVTIEQVASATKIGVRLLHALESDHYLELPAKPFVRGFVTSYARFVGIEAGEVLTRFGDFIDQKAQDRPSREGGHSGYAFERRDQSKTVLWVVMAGFIVLGGVAVFLFKKPHHHRGTQIEKLKAAHSGLPDVAAISPTPPPEVAAVVVAVPSQAPAPAIVPVAETPQAPATPVEIAAAEPSPAPTPTSETEAVSPPVPAPSPGANLADKLDSGADLKPDEVKHKAVIKAVGSVWVRYRVDSRPPRRFILRSGRMLVLKARDAIRFQSSNPKLVTIRDENGSYEKLSELTEGIARQKDVTLYFPTELADKTEDPFPGQKSLSGWSVPAPKPSDQPSTPSP